MSRPLLLDLFCGAGGCSMGYHRAGFDVVGVDIKPQRRYPFPFFEGDALATLRILNVGHGRIFSDGREYALSDFAAIHASPPCQFHTALRSVAEASASTPREYVDLIPPTRHLLGLAGLPYVIENVEGAETLDATLMLCGTMFHLGTDDGAELQRHRYFEIPWWFTLDTPPCEHGWASKRISVAGNRAWGGQVDKRNVDRRRTICVTGTGMGVGLRGERRVITVTGHTPQQNTVRNQVRETFTVVDARQAMGIDWMTMRELSQAIPPAYTEWIGVRLMEHLRRVA